MESRCECGEQMEVGLRTVIYVGKVEIINVPVHTCKSCHRSKVLPIIKPDLTRLLDQLGPLPDKQIIRFDELNELAHLMVKVTDKQHMHESIDNILEERVNELLDMLLLAKSLKNEEWNRDICQRLQQITRYVHSTYELQ